MQVNFILSHIDRNEDIIKGPIGIEATVHILPPVYEDMKGFHFILHDPLNPKHDQLLSNTEKTIPAQLTRKTFLISAKAVRTTPSSEYIVSRFLKFQPLLPAGECLLACYYLESHDPENCVLLLLLYSPPSTGGGMLFFCRQKVLCA